MFKTFLLAFVCLVLAVPAQAQNYVLTCGDADVVRQVLMVEEFGQTVVHRAAAARPAFSDGVVVEKKDLIELWVSTLPVEVGLPHEGQYSWTITVTFLAWPNSIDLEVEQVMRMCLLVRGYDWVASPAKGWTGF